MDEYKPVTGELRRRGYLTEANIEVDGAVTFAKVYFGTKDFRDLCDDIDSVHAQLERENKSLREKVRHQSAQLSEVQGALERRNNGELKRHWQKELDRLKAERDSMAAALDAAQGEHAYAPESHYMMLPKDADGVPIHVGDTVTCGRSVWQVTGLRLTGAAWGVCCTIFNDHGGSGTNVYPPCDLRHYHAPTVEDVLRGVVTLCHNTWKKESAFHFYDVDDVMESGNIADLAAKLRLAGEK